MILSYLEILQLESGIPTILDLPSCAFWNEIEGTQYVWGQQYNCEDTLSKKQSQPLSFRY